MFNTIFGEDFIANLMTILKHKKAVEYTITKKGDKWALTAENENHDIVFSVDVTDEEAMLVMSNLSRLPVSSSVEEPIYLRA